MRTFSGEAAALDAINFNSQGLKLTFEFSSNGLDFLIGFTRSQKCGVGVVPCSLCIFQAFRDTVEDARGDVASPETSRRASFLHKGDSELEEIHDQLFIVEVGACKVDLEWNHRDPLLWRWYRPAQLVDGLFPR